MTTPTFIRRFFKRPRPGPFDVPEVTPPPLNQETFNVVAAGTIPSLMHRAGATAALSMIENQWEDFALRIAHLAGEAYIRGLEDWDKETAEEEIEGVDRNDRALQVGCDSIDAAEDFLATFMAQRDEILGEAAVTFKALCDFAATAGFGDFREWLVLYSAVTLEELAVVPTPGATVAHEHELIAAACRTDAGKVLEGVSS
jgi:hypothetical protein